MNKDGYKFLVASDMDYTLLMPGKPVSEKNLEAIRAIRDAGGAFTLATGRSSYITGIYTHQLGIDVPIITSNGAALFDPIARRDVFSCAIPSDVVLKLLRGFIDLGSNATGYSPDGIFLLPGSSRRKFMNEYNDTIDNLGLGDELKAVLAECVDEDVRAWESGSKELPVFNKFLLIRPDEASLELVRSFPELDTVSSAGNFCDVMPRGISKGNALLQIADMIGVGHSKTYALGDSENDLSLIEAAGCGIAMANSDPRLLAAADRVTSTCEEDGFAEAVFKVLNEIG